MIYLELLWSFMQIGLFSIGGGYAAMPVIQSQVVDLHHWLTLEEFADVITIAEMTPGPIAINSATFVGIQVAGIPGAIVSTLGCVIPSCIIVLTLAFFYYKYKNLRMVQGVLEGLRPAIVALIASAGLSILILSVFGNNGISWAIHQINCPEEMETQPDCGNAGLRCGWDAGLSAYPAGRMNFFNIFHFIV